MMTLLLDTTVKTCEVQVFVLKEASGLYWTIEPEISHCCWSSWFFYLLYNIITLATPWLDSTFQLSFCGFHPVSSFWPLTSDINQAFSSTQLLLPLFLELSCDVMKTPVDQRQIVKRSHLQVATSWVTSLLFSGRVLILLWPSAGRLHHLCIQLLPCDWLICYLWEQAVLLTQLHQVFFKLRLFPDTHLF